MQVPQFRIRDLPCSDPAFNSVVQVNVRAPFVMGQECAKRMIARGKGGKIVNTSSTASVFALHEHASYVTSKAAINGLTRVRQRVHTAFSGEGPM